MRTAGPPVMLALAAGPAIVLPAVGTPPGDPATTTDQERTAARRPQIKSFRAGNREWRIGPGLTECPALTVRAGFFEGVNEGACE